MAFPLMNLPTHVVEYVLSCLGNDRPMLLRCRLVCRKMNELIFGPELGIIWAEMKHTHKTHMNWELTSQLDTYSKLQKDRRIRAKEQALSFLDFLPNVADHVEELKFHAIEEVSVTVLQALPSMPALKSLDLSGNKWLMTQHLTEFAQKCNNVRIISLAMPGLTRHCKKLQDTAFAVMINNWSSLESVDISSSCTMGDKNGRMSLFHDSLDRLEIYKCGHIDNVYDSTILRLLNRDGVAERLKVLRVSGEYLTDPSFIAMGSCINLEFLGTSFCRQITDAALQPLKNLTALKHLHLCHANPNANLTADGLADFFKEAPFKLQHLSLNGTTAVDDSVVQHILQQNRGLKSLSLGSCTSVTDAGLAQVRNLQDLRLLDCRFLNKVNGNFLDFDLRCLPNLRFVRVRFTNVSSVDGQSLQERFPHVTFEFGGQKGDWIREVPISHVKGTEGWCCISMYSCDHK